MFDGKITIDYNDIPSVVIDKLLELKRSQYDTIK